MTPPLDPSPAGDVPEMDPEQLLREFPPKPKDEAYLRALAEASGGRALTDEERATNEKNADALFETYKVAEVREIEKKTRLEAAEKARELKKLRGGSYLDAIATADAIEAIERHARCAVEKLGELNKMLQDLPDPAVTTRGDSSSEPAFKVDEITGEIFVEGEEDLEYATGSRVKFLVDTPEKIWGSLEEGDLLGAAERFLAASDVYSALERGEGDDGVMLWADVLKMFPLVKQQGPLLDSFRAQIARRAREELRAKSALDASRASSAVAACVLVEDLSAAEALALAMQSRRAHARAILRRGAEGKTRGKAANALARTLLDARRTTLLASQCFLPGADADGGVSVSVPRAFRDIVGSSSGSEEGTRREMDTSFAGVAVPKREAERRRARVEARATALATRAPSRRDVAAACEAYLTGVAEDVARAVESRGLLNSVRSLGELAAFEKDVTRRMERAGGGGGGKPGASDEDLAVSDLLGTALDAFGALAEKPFVQRARALLRDALSHAPTRAAIDAALKATTTAAAAAPAARPAALWGKGAVATTDDASPDAPCTPGRETASSSVSSSSSISAIVARGIAMEVATTLAETRREASALTAGGSSSASSREDRAAAVEEYAHHEAHAGMASLASFLRSKLAEEKEDATATATERALLIGQTAHAIATDAEPELATMLAPRDAWGVGDETSRRFASGALGRRAGGKYGKAPKLSTAAQEQLADATAALRAARERGFKTWAVRVAADIGAAVSRSLASDDTVTSAELPAEWEEETVADAGGDMTLRLPSQPSPRVLDAMRAAADEATRVGGHLLPSAATHALGAACARECAHVYDAFVKTTNAGGIGEKWTIQALFDVMTITRVFVGAEDRGGGGGGGGAQYAWATRAASEARAIAASATDALSSTLDPIDWATYESFLTRNASSWRRRVSALLGLFARGVGGGGGRDDSSIETARVGSGGLGGGGGGGALPPRFSYLPVSLPSLRGGRARAGAGGAGAGGVDWTAAGFDRFGDASDVSAYAAEEGANFLGKLGQGLGLGKSALGWT